MLKDLRRARYVYDNSREIFLFIKGIKKLYSGIIAALKLGKRYSIGVTPHFCRAIRVEHAAAHTYRSTTESGGKKALFSCVPSAFNSRCYFFGKKIRGSITVEKIITAVRNKLLVLYIRHKIPKNSERGAVHSITSAAVIHRGMCMYCVDHNFIKRDTITFKLGFSKAQKL